MSQSQKMRNALSKYVIPNLTDKGFVGKYPHYKRIYDDRIELLVFERNKLGNSFAVEVSTIFLNERKNGNNFYSGSFKKAEDATVWDTLERYRLKGMFDGWFYYTDVYKYPLKVESKSFPFYEAVSETRAQNYTPKEDAVLVQKADSDIYRKVCDLVNAELPTAFEWWDTYNKNNKVKKNSRFWSIFKRVKGS